MMVPAAPAAVMSAWAGLAPACRATMPAAKAVCRAHDRASSRVSIWVACCSDGPILGHQNQKGWVPQTHSVPEPALAVTVPADRAGGQPSRPAVATRAGHQGAIGRRGEQYQDR